MKSLPSHIRIAFAGFAGAGVLFLVLYFILSGANRPAADDFYFLHALESQGILSMSWSAYNTWITRWTALPLTGLVFRICGTEYFWFHAITLLALLTACASWFRYLLERQSVRPGIFVTVLFALLFVLAFFQLSVSAGETWFWVTSVCMYLWPLIILLAGCRLLVQPTNLPLPWRGLGEAFCFACFLFVGGGSEVVALEALILLGVVAWLKQRYQRAQFVPWNNLLLAMAALILSLGIAWLGEGRAARQDALPELSPANYLLLAVQSAGYFLLVQIPVKIHWILFFVIPWIVLRQAFQPGRNQNVPAAFAFAFKAAGVFGTCVLLHYLVATGLLRSFPPARTSLGLSFALAALCAVIGWRLGALTWTAVRIRFITACFVLASSVLLIYAIGTQKEITTAYARAFDERMKLLRKSQAKEAFVTPLPSPGMLYSAEISTDTAHFINRQLRDYLHLDEAPRRNEK